MVQTYKLKKGDTLSDVAKQFHHRKWETIWEAAENKALVAKRRKPEALQPGDEVTIPPNEKQQAAAKADAGKKTFTLSLKGKKHVLTDKEFDSATREMLDALKKAVAGAQQRTVAARVCWDSFAHLNDDQWFVSWCVGLRGPKLPPESVVKAAEQAQDRLSAAVASGNFKKIATDIKTIQDTINSAYTAMMQYRQAVIGRGEKQLIGLEFVRDTAFDVVGAIATVEMGGTPAAGAGGGAFANVIKSSAGELGKYLAGTSSGGEAATRSIIIDGVIGAATGAVGPLLKLRGDKIIEGAAKAAAKKMAGKWAGRLASDKMAAFLVKRLGGALKGGLESAVKNGLQMVKRDTTPEQFCAKLAMDMGLGGTLSGLDGWIEKNFAGAVYRKMVAGGLKLQGKETEETVVAMIADLISGKEKVGVAKAIEVSLEKSKGEEDAGEIAARAAEEFAKAQSAQFEKLILKARALP